MKSDAILKEKDSWIKIALLLAAGVISGYFIAGSSLNADNDAFSEKRMDEKRVEFISEKEAIISEQIVKGDYACCLEKPCMYCIEKTPGHGEGARCSCLEDVVEGRHPCGECIGEIMEGHGNKFLAKFFARAIAEEVGNQHAGMLKKIIEEKYGKPIDEQL